MGVERELCERIDLLNEKAFALRAVEPQQAYDLAIQARELSEQADYVYGLGCAHRTLAASQTLTSLPETFRHALIAIDLLSTHGYLNEAVTAYPALFIYYVHTEQWALASSTINEAISMSQDVGATNSLSLCLYNRGFLHSRFSRFEEADADFENAYGMLQLPRDQYLSALILAERAAIWHRVSGSTFDLKDLVAELETANGKAKVDLLRGLAVHLVIQGRFDDARAAYRRARILCESLPASPALNQFVTDYAAALHTMGRSKHARRLQAICVASLSEKQQPMLVHLQMRKLAEYEFACGLFEQSARHYREYLPLKEGLFSATKEASLADFKVIRRIERLRQETHELSEMNGQLQSALERQTELQKELMRLATTDDLTGAFNRRQVINDGTLEMERYRHTGAPFTVSVIDIDHFKSINDTFGHAIGDEVLRRLTKAAQAILRRFDIFGRLGGEEFCILHHDSDIAGTTKAVERLQKAVSSLFVADILDDRTLTVSIGIAEVRREDNSFFDVLHQADLALYEAKRSGRNTFRVAQSRFLEAA